MPRPVRTPEISELRALCAAADLGSLSAAARLLGVSQPALSKRIAALEALAAARLLERSPRGVELTPAGRRLYEEARRLLVQAEVIESLLGSLHGAQAPVRLAASHTAAEHLLPGMLVRYEIEGSEHVSVELVIGNSPLVHEMVAGGRAELGVAVRAEHAADGVEQVPFFTDEVVVAVPHGHPWERRPVHASELVRERFVRRDPGANTRATVDRALADIGLEMAPPLMEVGSTAAASGAAVELGVPTLLSGAALPRQQGIARVQVTGVSFEREFVLLRAASEDAMRGPARHLAAFLTAQAAHSVRPAG